MEARSHSSWPKTCTSVLKIGEDFCSWCSSNRENDRRAVTIECASENTEPYEMTNVVISH